MFNDGWYGERPMQEHQNEQAQQENRPIIVEPIEIEEEEDADEVQIDRERLGNINKKSCV